MKIAVEKEYDGKFYVGCCTNVPGCYVQSGNPGNIDAEIEYALEVYLENCIQRNQPFPNENDKPVLDVRIRFDTISSDQLIKIFKRYHYYVDHMDDRIILFLNSDFPFNRVLIPNKKVISPLIIRRIFGNDNINYVGSNELRFNSSAS
jgi:predicted RNase H-like HicB family nuclease